ncbi:MAG: NADH:flavin oxidoreductase/NADH oxidase [Alphaproteobacteria bacterium]|jgi:2,4-dienoyl-CoA reductase-like NADH-dependent reductase (Old Yellow Enzyme family)
MTSKLFEPITMRGVTLPNRIILSPMCQYSACEGNANDWHMMHLGGYALSGLGLVITEAAAVEPRGRITQECVGIYSDDNEEALRRVVAFCRCHGDAPVGIQLAHAGRKASAHRPGEGRGPRADGNRAWRTIAASNIPTDEGWPAPAMMNDEDLAVVKQAFVAAAVRSERAGFDVIELHFAHGYLLHTFLSPLSNTRNDSYGGSLENRMRYPLEVYDAVRAVFPDDKPIGVRVSASDWAAGGWDIDGSVALSAALKARDCDYIAASSGGLVSYQEIDLKPGYQVPFSDEIRSKADIATMAVGLITDPHHAEAILQSGEADMIALARGLLYNPRWAWHASDALGVDRPYIPEQYDRGQPARD